MPYESNVAEELFLGRFQTNEVVNKKLSVGRKALRL